MAVVDKPEPGEPVFTLLGRDPCASLVLYAWRAAHSAWYGADRERLQEAKRLAEDMATWCALKGIGVTRSMQVRMLLNLTRFVTGCVSGLEEEALGDERRLVLISNAVDCLSNAQGYLETLTQTLEARGE